jgi:hypothetical protein
MISRDRHATSLLCYDSPNAQATRRIRYHIKLARIHILNPSVVVEGGDRRHFISLANYIMT